MTAAIDPIIAVDAGSARIVAARIEGGRIIERLQAPAPRTGHGSDLTDAVADQVRKITTTPRRLGVTTANIVANGCLTSFDPKTLAVESNYPIVAALRRRLGVQALVMNDVQAATIQESRHAAKNGVRRMALISVSAGIGTGIVLDGRLQIGPHGLAGHAGHMVVDINGPVCGCGRRGCAEAIASGSAIAERASEIAGRAMSTAAVFSGAHTGDAHCVQVLDRAGAALAAMIANLVASLDLDVVRLGGSVGMLPAFLNRLRAAMEALPAIYRRPIEPARGGSDAGLLGIAALMDEGLGEKPMPGPTPSPHLPSDP